MKDLSKFYQWLVQPLIVIGILVFGFLGARSFTMFEDTPEQTERETYAPLVRVITAQKSSQPIFINGNGTIEARTRINLVPQVGGRVTYIHPELRAGGSFAANEVLVQIEDIDFKLQVTQNEAQVAAARTALKLQIAEAEAASAEWFSLNPDSDIPTLVGREPQIAEARAQLKSAEALLEQAKLSLQRSSIRMPFAGRVVQSALDVGEVITANQPAGIVYSLEAFEIPVPLSIDDLTWINLPNDTNGRKGSMVKIQIPEGNRIHSVPGQVTRMESELEAVSRFARIVVTLFPRDIPAELREKVIPGLFVNLQIKGKQLDQVTVVPRTALREDNQLWVIKDNQLHFMPVNIIHTTEDKIMLQDLPDDTQIVVSNLDVVTHQMDVRVSEDT